MYDLAQLGYADCLRPVACASGGLLFCTRRAPQPLFVVSMLLGIAIGCGSGGMSSDGCFSTRISGWRLSHSRLGPGSVVNDESLFGSRPGDGKDGLFT